VKRKAKEINYRSGSSISISANTLINFEELYELLQRKFENK
jgi:hypothetical protein